MLTLLAQTAQFIALHAILRVVDRTSALPRDGTPSEACVRGSDRPLRPFLGPAVKRSRAATRVARDGLLSAR